MLDDILYVAELEWPRQLKVLSGISNDMLLAKNKKNTKLLLGIKNTLAHSISKIKNKRLADELAKLMRICDQYSLDIIKLSKKTAEKRKDENLSVDINRITEQINQFISIYGQQAINKNLIQKMATLIATNKSKISNEHADAKSALSKLENKYVSCLRIINDRSIDQI